MADSATFKVIFMMADYGHDPTETAVPFTAFKDAGFDISFATEAGKQPVCDKKMLEGFTQKILGADASTISAYKDMLQHPSIQSPVSWTSPDFTLEPYNLVFFPGGHEKGVRQVIDSSIVHSHVAKYFPETLRSTAHNANGQKKAVGAVCHGVMVLSSSIYPEGSSNAGKSVLHNVDTTALPATFEKVAYYGTKLWLGDYYKTYGAGSENVQESVTKVLENKSQFKNSIGTGPFVVEDPKYRYLSARFPGDAKLLGEKLVQLVKG